MAKAFFVKKVKGNIVMTKILICDDEQKIIDVLKEYCEFNGYQVVTAHNGEEALLKVQKENFDCIIMDIMMPVMNGYDAIKEIKKIKNIPVIITSARNEEYDILHGFSLGIDDYVCKPFSPREIMARVKAILLRSGVKERFKIGNLEIDTLGRDVYVAGKKIKLTNKEYDLLMFLIKNKGICIDREKLLNTIWTDNYDIDGRTVDTHIKMLRADLGECAKYIITVRGVGYKFDED